MELAAVNFLGNNFKKMMQKSSSLSDGGDIFLPRLAGGFAGGVAFFFVAFAGVVFFGVRLAFFSFRVAMFSGEVSTLVCGHGSMVFWVWRLAKVQFRQAATNDWWRQTKKKGTVKLTVPMLTVRTSLPLLRGQYLMFCDLQFVADRPR